MYLVSGSNMRGGPSPAVVVYCSIQYIPALPSPFIVYITQFFVAILHTISYNISVSPLETSTNISASGDRHTTNYLSKRLASLVKLDMHITFSLHRWLLYSRILVSYEFLLVYPSCVTYIVKKVMVPIKNSSIDKCKHCVTLHTAFIM